MIETITANGLLPRLHCEWRLRGRSLALGHRTLVMGILNLTPDSFSDGGLYASPAEGVERGLRLLEEGADILDIGGESTRPGADFVSPGEEMARVLPVIAELARRRPEAVLSIDTSKAEVARAAVEAGVHIVNDVSGLMWDDEMAKACAQMQCGVVVSHSRGYPDAWAALPPLDKDAVLPLVRGDLQESLDRGARAGISKKAMIIDPGFGFGKRGEENFRLLAQLPELATLGRPILCGLSRKSFLAPPASPPKLYNGNGNGYRNGNGNGNGNAAYAGGALAQSRAMASVAAAVAAALRGAHLVRVHDVKPTLEAVAMADALLRAAD